jgi:hypothetical protein
MWKQYFADHPAVPFGLVAMVIFMSLFVISVIFAMRKPRSELSDIARLPLADDLPGSHGFRGVER